MNLVETLMAAGAHPNITTEDGRAPLSAAYQRCHLGVLERSKHNLHLKSASLFCLLLPELATWAVGEGEAIHQSTMDVSLEPIPYEGAKLHVKECPSDDDNNSSSNNSSLDEAVLILNGAAEMLRERGIPQWEGFSRKQLQEELQRGAGRCFLVLHHGRPLPIATFCLLRASEPWANLPLPASSSDGNDVLYLGRLSVHARLLGHGVGAAVFAAVERTARSLECSHLRLDCWAGNDKLKRFYSDCGMVHLRDVPELDYQVSLFEKRLLN